MESNNVDELFEEIDSLPTEKISLLEYLRLNIKLLRLIQKASEHEKC